MFRNNMASQTMRSSKPENPFAPPPVQAHLLAKLKQQEEEELWISGEELYTEGSSDEEDYRPGARNCRRTSNNNSSRSSSANPTTDKALSDSTSKTKTDKYNSTTKLAQTSCNSTITKSDVADDVKKENSKMTVSTKEVSNSCKRASTSIETNSKQEVESDLSEEQESDTKISWKANRGSFVLPKVKNNTDKEKNGC